MLVHTDISARKRDEEELASTTASTSRTLVAERGRGAGRRSRSVPATVTDNIPGAGRPTGIATAPAVSSTEPTASGIGGSREDYIGPARATSSSPRRLAARAPYVQGGAERRAAAASSARRSRRDGCDARPCWIHYIPDIADGVVRGFFVLATDVTRDQARRAAPAAAQPGAGRRAQPGRGGDGRQERLPRQHEPRDPHADERDHRPDAPAAPRPAPSRASASGSPRCRTRRTTCSRVINDILDLSKIESGKLELEAIDFSLDSMLDAWSARWSPRARGPRASSSSIDTDGLPRDAARRRDAALAGAAQPARQRRQVHRRAAR